MILQYTISIILTFAFIYTCNLNIAQIGKQSFFDSKITYGKMVAFYSHHSFLLLFFRVKFLVNVYFFLKILSTVRKESIFSD